MVLLPHGRLATGKYKGSTKDQNKYLIKLARTRQAYWLGMDADARCAAMKELIVIKQQMRVLNNGYHVVSGLEYLSCSEASVMIKKLAACDLDPRENQPYSIGSQRKYVKSKRRLKRMSKMSMTHEYVDDSDPIGFYPQHHGTGSTLWSDPLSNPAQDIRDMVEAYRNIPLNASIAWEITNDIPNSNKAYRSAIEQVAKKREAENPQVHITDWTRSDEKER